LSRGQRAAVKWGPFEQGDITDGARLKAALVDHNIAAVMHLAGFAYVHESIVAPLRYYMTNVVGTITLLKAMRDANVSRIVASSSCAVYESSPEPLREDAAVGPASPYARTKIMMERTLADCEMAYGLRWVALRYFNAAGADPDGEAGETTDAGVRVIPNLFDVALGRKASFQINGDDYPTQDGTCVRDFTHVSDIARGHVDALKFLDTTNFGVFNLGNGHGHSIRAVIAAAEAATGRPIPTTIGPRRQGDPPSLVADATAARTTLGWQPQWSGIADMVAHAWAWHSKTQRAQHAG
ncbi:MAG: UDP-glucose 4-epimerase GalE, partial [Candidatus Binataceae bacterium]